MQAIFSEYDFQKSLERIDDILDGSDALYEDRRGIPDRSALTFNNGFYVDVTVVFIDLRDSKELATKHTRPVLAKIYRTYISEVVAILNSDPCISEIYIEGDGVWAVFNTTSTPQVNRVLDTACRVSSLIKVLNVKFRKRGYSEIKAGIGIEDGESLYIKAGYKGSSINEVVWIGKVVGTAAKLCDRANRSWLDEGIMISSHVYGMLTDENKRFFSYHIAHGCYHGNAFNAAMYNWISSNG